METVTELDVVGHACPPESIRTRVRAWDLHKFQLNVTDGPWLRLGLNRPATGEAVCIATQVSGRTTKHYGDQRRAPRDETGGRVAMIVTMPTWDKVNVRA
jgi:hypothetical protein